VLEPTYQAIRNKLMTGAWPIGLRLEAGRLADELGVSITPVRDSLNRLVGEKLVDLVPGIGFHVPHLTGQRFRDLLDLHLTLLLAAMARGGKQRDLALTDLPGEDHAERTGALFSRIAALSGNAEIAGAVQAVGARLHAIRLCEQTVLGDVVAELTSLQTAIAAQQGGGQLGGLLRRYHSVRKRNASQLVAAAQAGTAR
jgi:hypothetical protein